MSGIVNTLAISSNLAIASNATLATAGLSFNIAASQRIGGFFYLPYSVGATGGIRLQVVVPAAPTAFNASIVQPAVTTGIASVITQVASAAYTNALAVAANYTTMVYFSIVNGTTAGTVDLQIAQNTSDALTLTLFAGAYVQYNAF